MDADDISVPQRLERQLAFLRKHEDIAFVGCCARKFDQHGVYGEIVYPACPDKKDLLFNSCFVHPTVMMRRSVLTAAGGYSEADSRVRCEDYDLWLRLYAMGYRGANLQERLLDYYEGSQNLYKRNTAIGSTRQSSARWAFAPTGWDCGAGPLYSSRWW